MGVDYERRGRVAVITIRRPEVRNAIDRATAAALGDAWRTFDADPDVDVGVLYGIGGHFSAGADLKAFDLVDSPRGYLGFTRTQVSKPTIAAIEGYCVAGGLEMALWCDLRVAGATAVFGCLERRFGVPLVDGGTVRLTHVVGLGHALDLILTGREVGADEAGALGLVNRVVEAGLALDTAVELGEMIGSHPQETVRSDRASVLAALGVATPEALERERRFGNEVMDIAAAGADRFAAGRGRSGEAVTIEVEPVSAQAEPSHRPLEQEITPPGDQRLRIPPSGHGRPVLVVTSPAEEGWREAVETTLLRLGYVIYGVRATGELRVDEPALEAAAIAVLSSAAVLGDRIGIVALGGGAGPALHYSTVDGRVAAVVEFSGRRSSTPPSFRLATARYLGHHGSADEAPETIPPFQMESALRDMGLDATFHSYRGAAADFFVPGSPGHHPTFTDVAWQRTKMFLARAL